MKTIFKNWLCFYFSSNNTNGGLCYRAFGRKLKPNLIDVCLAYFRFQLLARKTISGGGGGKKKHFIDKE